MAMNTWLQMIDDEELAALEKNPSLINKMNKPDKESCSTYFQCCINYFLTGDAYPSGKKNKPLTVFLSGLESVECSTLENGYFHLVPASMAPAIVAALEKVDKKALKKKVAAADPDELEEAEVDDYEILTDSDDDPGETLVADVERLLDFYRAAAKNKRGVVIYTS